MTMDETLVVSDITTLKVLADDLRLRIYELVRSSNEAGNLCTVKMLAERLGMPAAKLYYHVNMMEAAGLLRVDETRLVSGILEKYYSAAARRLIINQLTGSGGEALPDVISGLINAAFGDLRGLVKGSTVERGQADNLNIRISKQRLNLTEREADALVERLSALLAEFALLGQVADENEVRQAYQLVNVLYQPE